MSKDPTFRILGDAPSRSERYSDYRKEWDRRESALDAADHPVHVDIETAAVCDLRCGSSEDDPKGFCQVWTHEHLRTRDFGLQTGPPGYMDPILFGRLIQQCADIGVSSIKLNYRGEASLHPRIVDFVRAAAELGFPDVMLNTNGNGRARQQPDLFARIVEAGITDLMFSVDACDSATYRRQRVGGDWDVLLRSVRSAVDARGRGLGAPDCRIRASVVRTNLNAADIASGRMESFWKDEMGVDWMSVSECYFPAGKDHHWKAAHWVRMTAAEFQCPDPFRRMVVTWDGRHTMPCCQGFTLEIDGGPVVPTETTPVQNLRAIWLSPNFARLREAHRNRTWDDPRHGERICRACAVTQRPIRIEDSSLTNATIAPSAVVDQETARGQ
ncbi:MAG: SPASM domain-containing protein [Vicinamibacteria bacterium]|nr:SPASM domain-containing protein [Vicinamibacteria bacterium]